MKIQEKIELGNGRTVSLATPFVNEGIEAGLQPIRYLAFRDEVSEDQIAEINTKLAAAGSSHRLRRESFFDFEEMLEKTREYLEKHPAKNPIDAAWRVIGSYDLAERIVAAL